MSARLIGLIVLASTAGACRRAPPPAAPAPEARAPAEGHVETPDGVKLYYQPRGDGPDTIVVLHGGPGLGLPYLAPDLEPLTASHHLVHYDQRGAGRSTLLDDPERLGLDDHVADVDAIRAHFELDRVVLLGHSWGAGPAAFYALAHPERVASLILVDPMPARATPWMAQFGSNLVAWMDEETLARFQELDAAQAEAEDPVAACRAFWGLFLRGYLADSTDPATLKGDVCGDPPDALRVRNLAYEAALGPEGDWDWRERIAAIEAPTLILAGAASPIPVASSEEWHQAMPASELVTIEAAGHFPHAEQPEAFTRAVDEFLSRTR